MSKPKTPESKLTAKRPAGKYADPELAQALHAASTERDPDLAAPLYEKALALLQVRGVGFSIGGFHGGVPRAAKTREARRRQTMLDNAVWVLTSAQSMGKMADDYRETLSECARFFDAPPALSPTEAKALDYIQRHPGAHSDEIAKNCGIEPGTFRNMVKRLKAPDVGVTSRRGCTGGYWPPPRAR